MCRDKLRELIRSHDLAADEVEVVTARPLAPEEAIGSPARLVGYQRFRLCSRS
ncbi:MAG: hypothetical protein ACM3X3_03660 [Betaproteobacteria bacterium]